MALLIAGAAVAQTYRISDLTPLGFAPDSDQMGQIEDITAINDNGEIVGSYMVDIDPPSGNFKRHAFLFLPAANYGLPAGLNDLHVLSGLSDDESVARDINDAGIVVGQTGGTSVGTGQAIVWNVPAGTVCPLGFLIAPNSPNPCYPDPPAELVDNPWSVAYAINDDNPPLVVGDALWCPHPGVPGAEPCGPENYAFRVVFDPLAGCPSLLTDAQVMLPVDPDNGSYARDINDTPAGGPAETIGISSTPFGTQCNAGQSDAVTWPPDTPTMAMLELPMGPAGPGDHAARGINDSSLIIGSGFTSIMIEFDQRALLWNGALAAPENLGSVMPTIPVDQTGDESHAEGINDEPLPKVVGWNATRFRALLWEAFQSTHPGGGFQAGDFNVTDLTGALACPAGVWEVRRAFDVNNNGWITAVADANPAGQLDLHVVLLRPITTCLYDVSGPGGGPPDGLVGITDFLNLFGSWGACDANPSDVLCSADFDCDGIVGITDFLDLLGNWGCCVPCSQPPPTLQEEFVEAGLEWPQDWNTFNDCFANGTKAERDNCLCWLNHYLEDQGCHTLLCTPPTCPGADPFADPPLTHDP